MYLTEANVNRLILISFSQRLLVLLSYYWVRSDILNSDIELSLLLSYNLALSAVDIVFILQSEKRVKLGDDFLIFELELADFVIIIL